MLRHPCRELTAEQKEDNKQISRQRIFIEHLIRRLKIFRIAADKFRLNPPNYETVILTRVWFSSSSPGNLFFSSLKSPTLFNQFDAPIGQLIL
jgi:hypothetical protein